MQPPDILFLFVLLAFTLADIIFHNFLELQSKISEKNIFLANFPFQPICSDPPPPERPKSAKCNKSFLSMLPEKLEAGAPLKLRNFQNTEFLGLRKIKKAKYLSIR